MSDRKTHAWLTFRLIVAGFIPYRRALHRKTTSPAHYAEDLSGLAQSLVALMLKTGKLSTGIRIAPSCSRDASRDPKGVAMLYYALVFLVIALVAGLLGFGVVAFAAAEIARICFFIFIVLFVVSLLSHVVRTRNP
jgi:uncharacterized membrane protein YtjA (UPF0391 family)